MNEINLTHVMLEGAKTLSNIKDTFRRKGLEVTLFDRRSKHDKEYVFPILERWFPTEVTEYVEIVISVFVEENSTLSKMEDREIAEKVVELTMGILSGAKLNKTFSFYNDDDIDSMIIAIVHRGENIFQKLEEEVDSYMKLVEDARSDMQTNLISLYHPTKTVEIANFENEDKEDDWGDAEWKEGDKECGDNEQDEEIYVYSDGRIYNDEKLLEIVRQRYNFAYAENGTNHTEDTLSLINQEINKKETEEVVYE